jgi:integrase
MSSPARGKRLPAYRLDKRSGKAVVTLNHGGGARQSILLGEFGSSKSKIEYNRVIAEWMARNCLPEPAIAEPDVLTIGELIVRFWQGKVVTYYRHADGSPTSEQENYKQCLRTLRQLYEDLPVAQFDSLRLEAWLGDVTRPTRTIIDSITGQSREVQGWSRNNANKHLSRIKSVFKWGVRKKLVGAAQYGELTTVEGLEFGRSDARETEPIRQVAPEFVEAVIPFLSDQVAAIARLQILCGARPGELCSMTTAEIQTTGIVDPGSGKSIWMFRPTHHKTQHRGHVREIPLGPQCQEILRPFLKADLGACLFSPAEAEADRLAALHAARTTPMKYGNVPGSNRVESPQHKPGNQYTVAAYRRAIQRGCEKAFPPPEHLHAPEQRKELAQWRRDHRWHPHQARHTAGTLARATFGPEGAQVMLGHKHVKTTEIYAERDMALAVRVAAKIG